MVGIDGMSVRAGEGVGEGVVPVNGRRQRIMSVRDHEVVRLHLLGMSGQEIAEKLGVGRATVYNALNSEGGVKKIEEIQELRDRYSVRVQKKICELTEKSLSVYEGVLNGVDEAGNEVKVGLREKLRVADAVLLELSGFVAAKKVQTQSTLVTAGVIEELRRRSDEEMVRRGYEVIDIESREVEVDGGDSDGDVE